MLKFKMVLLLAFMVLLGCTSTGVKDKKQITEQNSVFSKQLVNPQFNEFYSSFISDSVFQISHIQFPLEGGIVYCDSIQEFTKSNWKPINGNFLKSIIKEDSLVINHSDDEIELKLIRPEIGVLNELKFKKINGVWYLFYILSNAC